MGFKYILAWHTRAADLGWGVKWKAGREAGCCEYRIPRLPVHPTFSLPRLQRRMNPFIPHLPNVSTSSTNWVRSLSSSRRSRRTLGVKNRLIVRLWLAHVDLERQSLYRYGASLS